ncbi:MAG: hypothetical protein AAB575_04010 [Patescibacteria group bacterium]
MSTRVKFIDLFHNDSGYDSEAVTKTINRAIESLEKGGHKIIGGSACVIITYTVNPNYLNKLRKPKKTSKEISTGNS